MNVINAVGLTKYYGKHLGIKDISFEVKAGEKFGFVGPNGAGKSTFIRLLLGMLRPTSGRVELFGENVVQNGAKSRLKVGYIPAEVNYYAAMSSRALLEYSAGFHETADLNMIDELADYFELNLTKHFNELSTGNKKKTAIIQSLLHRPELLIMDEPTSGLDPLIKNKFFDLLEQKNEAGLTIFFSSHVLSEIQRLCSKAVVIRGGEVIAIENVQDLLKKQVKKCAVTYREKPTALDFPASFKHTHWQGNKLLFEYSGDINALSGWFAAQSLIDLAVEEPDLETIFMNYYQR